MKLFYNLIFLLYSIAYLPALIFKGKFHRRFAERLGVYDPCTLEKLGSSRKAVWIHAVSVGELAAARPVVRLLKDEFPELKIVISTTTKAGKRYARDVLSDTARVAIIYSPLDFSFITEKAANLIRPYCYIMMETEIWPNIILTLSDKKIPIVLLNGRISDRSYGSYKAAGVFLRPILKKIDAFCMRSASDAERIIAIGAEKEKVKITGNIKFDTVKADADIGAEELRKYLGIGDDERLIVAGSTHHGEEEIVLKAYKALLKKYKGLRLLIAPRHVERVSAIKSLVKKHHLGALRISAVKEAGEKTKGLCPVLLLDTVGQLKDVYAAAEIVFMGGSLVKKGGHNLIEPAVHARAMVFGPYMFNFKDMSELFLENSASVQVRGGEALTGIIERLLDDEKMREELGDNARRLVEANSGATARAMEVIRKALKDSRKP